MPKILTNEYSDDEKERIREMPYLDPSFAVFMKAADDIMARMGLKDKVERTSKMVNILFDK